MARKSFISYKYNEAKHTRDAIIEALGEDARYYQGERAESPDMTGATVECIKRSLKDMIHGSSVTIIVLSPNFTQSKWIDWEIEYSLCEYTRNDRTSNCNGILAVIQDNSGYEWLIGTKTYPDGCTSRTVADDKLFNIIRNNRYNLITPEYICSQCKTLDILAGSYISIVAEKDFLADPNKYIENAFEKSKNSNAYRLCKDRSKDSY